MNSKNKSHSLLRIIVFIIFIVGTLTGLIFSIETSSTHKIKKETDSANIYSRKISDSNLKSDVESLELTVNLSQQTFSYDVYFKTNKFNGKEISSYFLRSPLTGSANPELPYEKITFNNSTTKISNKHASNVTSYEQLANYKYTEIVNWARKIQLGVQVEQNGVFYGITNKIVEFSLDWEDLFKIDDSSIIMNINDDKTFAQIDFILDYDLTNINLSKIDLKSKTDDHFGQTIYSNEDEFNIISGKNKVLFQLQNETIYNNLYLSFTFEEWNGNYYAYEAPITNDVNFTSGIIKDSWNSLSIILLIITLILIIIAILFIIAIARLMKRRKDLEKLDDLEYLENNY